MGIAHVRDLRWICRARAICFGGAIVACFGAYVSATMAQDPNATPGQVVAQDAPAVAEDAQAVAGDALQGGVEWINTTGPLRLEQLRGKFVLLDFWTYCCINCLQTLPDIKRLEQSYPNQLVVIGVHAPKFFGERDSANIREAVLRHHIEHPVVNDANAVIAQHFGITGWPSLRLIDPQGNLVASHDGETTFEQMNTFMKRAVPRYRHRRLLDESPVAFVLERFRDEPKSLFFPGKVCADPVQDRLFVSDSGHNRLVVLTSDGQLIETIGSGQSALTDGTYAEAAFSNPQGLALRGETLYVADTDNHAIRAVDLAAKTVKTVAGNGQQSLLRPDFRATSQLKAVALASPWDLLIHDDELYIAMAGTHQIWRMTLDRSRLQVFAGNVKEDIVDGPLLVHSNATTVGASFAQPSGLASDGKTLYVADSEGSSIRSIPLIGRGDVGTLLGTAGLAEPLRLFTFGDRDGPLGQALLQHPLGITYWQGHLYVADTYNNRIKEIDFGVGEIHSVAGDAAAGQSDDPPRFNEPGGLSIAKDRLYIADTNNHRIRVMSLQGSRAVTTLKIKGLKPVSRGLPSPPAIAAGAIELPAVRIDPGPQVIRSQLHVPLPEGSELNSEAPVSYVVNVIAGDPILAPSALGKRTHIKKPANPLEVRLPLARQTGTAKLDVQLSYFYCDTGSHAICRIGSAHWIGEVTLSVGGETIWQVVKPSP